MKASDEVTTFQAARPALRWSSEASRRASSYGSLKVALTVPASPSRSVTAASAFRTVIDSGLLDDVEVVDAAVVLAQPQPLGQEEEVEEAALGGPGEMLEGGEVDLRARARIGPDGGGVDAGEVRGEVDLLPAPSRAHARAPVVTRASAAYWLTGRSSPRWSRRVVPS